MSEFSADEVARVALLYLGFGRTGINKYAATNATQYVPET